MMSYVAPISISNKALQFIDYRLSFPDYRGSESSQHNRYDMNDVYKILTLLDWYVPNKQLMRIRTQDTKARPLNTPEEYLYAQFCEQVKRETGIGTQDAMRKNLFVDWHRMGLIRRYNRNQQRILPNVRSSVYYVSLSGIGLNFIHEKNLVERSFLFAKALNRMLLGFISNIINLFTTTDITQIDFYEFMFFASAIDHKTYGISVSECESLIGEYRLLARGQKLAVIDTLNQRLIPNLFSGTKTDSRDWHNWVNKYQQIWYLLDQVLFFQLENHLNPPLIRPLAKDKIFKQPEQTKFKSSNMRRSDSAKADYFFNHELAGRVKGFELDHIVPLMLANNLSEYSFLDDWRNMLYIDGTTHATKTQNASRFRRLLANHEDYNILQMSDDRGAYLNIINGDSGLFHPKNVPNMVIYNKEFLDFNA